MYKVAVLMSTYNGEKYLREQIDSILAQEGVNVTLYIRDDGSSDSTIDIIKDYLKHNNKVKLDIGKNMGVGNSFMQLVYDVGDEFDYYAFADQDDVWYSNKLAKAIEIIGNIEEPRLYGSNQELIDKDKGRLGLRYSSDFHMVTEVESVFQINHISGCTLVFNRRLRNLLCEVNRRPTGLLLNNRIHDVWVVNVAALYGGLIYDVNAYIGYRQHDNNVIGAYSHGILFNIKEKIRKIRQPKYRNGRSLISYELSNTFPEKAVEHPIIYCCHDGLTRQAKKYLLRNIKRIKMYTNEGYISLVIKICFGFY